MLMVTRLKEMPRPIYVSMDLTKKGIKLKNAGLRLHIPVSPIRPLSLIEGMIHDCAISKNWIIFILLPLCVSLDRLKQGGKHFMWDSDLPMCLGLLPRNNPKSDDIRWYPYTPESFIGHIGNAFDIDEQNVCLDTPLENGNVFGAFFPTDKNEAPQPGTVTSRFVRFHIDTTKKSGTFVGEPEELIPVNGGMPRIDDRYCLSVRCALMS